MLLNINCITLSQQIILLCCNRIDDELKYETGEELKTLLDPPLMDG